MKIYPVGAKFFQSNKHNEAQSFLAIFQMWLKITCYIGKE